MTAWLSCFRSSHAPDSLKDGAKLDLGMEPTGDFCEQTREKRRVFGSIIYLLVFRPLQSGCSMSAVVFGWPAHF